MAVLCISSESEPTTALLTQPHHQINAPRDLWQPSLQQVQENTALQICLLPSIPVLMNFLIFLLRAGPLGIRKQTVKPDKVATVISVGSHASEHMAANEPEVFGNGGIARLIGSFGTSNPVTVRLSVRTERIASKTWAEAVFEDGEIIHDRAVKEPGIAGFQ
jgi:hypothetical protein